MLVTKQFLVPIDFHIIIFSPYIMEVSGDQQLFSCQYSSKYVENKHFESKINLWLDLISYSLGIHWKIAGFWEIQSSSAAS